MDAIAKVPGIDVLLVGPFDLGNNIGHPILDGTMHEDLKQAIAKIHKAAVDNDKKTGIYSTSGDQARQFADQGFHMVRPRSRGISLQKADSCTLGIRRRRYDCAALIPIISVE